MKSLRRIHIAEIIVVVVVLGLLFAVSLPKFSKAQIRADLAQAVTDLGKLSDAINAYYLDYKDTPPDFDGNHSSLSPAFNSQKGTQGAQFQTEIYSYTLLTTPTAYISSIPEDVFYVKAIKERWNYGRKIHPLYEYSNTIRERYNLGAQAFTLSSMGPDLDEDMMWMYTPSQAIKHVYHISNGVESNGEIYASHEGVIMPY